jgi:hypothetical protein
MNKYQRLVMTVAIIDLIILVMVPPFADRPLARHMLPSFDGFYPIFSKIGSQPIHRDLLAMQAMFVLVNALIAWLALQIHRRSEFHKYDYGKAIAALAGANILVMLLFPPFEPYSSLLRSPGPSFDSFGFIFGPRSARGIFTPLLYIEVIFVLINALSIFLLFNVIRRGEDVRRQRLLEMADRMSEEELAALTDTARQVVEDHLKRKQGLDTLGRKREERRKKDDPNYDGPERRRSQRRHKR